MYTAGEIARRFGLKMKGKKDTEIKTVCGLEDNLEKSLSYITKEKYLVEAENSNIPAFITLKECIVPGKINMISEDPELTINEIAMLFDKKAEYTNYNQRISDSASIGKNFRVSEFAYIGSNTQIGNNVTIFPNVVILNNVKIDDGTTIYPNVTIYNDCQIGKNCLLHSGVVIGADGYGYLQRCGKNVKTPQIGTVKIGNDVEIGANSTIDRAKYTETIIGNNVKIDNFVHIAHNVKIGDHVIIVSKTNIGGSTTIGKNTFLLGSTSITDHAKIGEEIIVLGGSIVTKSLTKPGQYAGYPARKASVWRNAIAQLYRK